MTAMATLTGAPSTERDPIDLEWKDIPWHKVTQSVRRLQMRIAKAFLSKRNAG